MRSLLQFLRQARHTHLQFVSGKLTEAPIYVIGNPAADLDSIVSAIVYAYCASNRLPTQAPRPHIPLLNLSNVPAGPELYRLRPEFVTALWLSTNFPALRPDERFENTPESGGPILREHVVTVADFEQSLRCRNAPGKLLVGATLVDWNALPHPSHNTPGQGSLSGLADVEFQAVACIDHHIDEHFMPRAKNLPADQPLIIQPGPGSCSSLVTNEMQKRGYWTADEHTAGEEVPAELVQVAKLALAPVLIDTRKLTAEGKVTEVDVHAVHFLRRMIESLPTKPRFDMDSFYEQIYEAKQNSLDLLTFNEVLNRDFKDWTETPQSRKENVKLGFCSCIKPIRWIMRKGDGVKPFLEKVRAFAEAEDKKLDVFVIMASFKSPDTDQFCRELFVYVVSEDNRAAAEGVKAFVEQATSQLGLVDWSPMDGDRVGYPPAKDVRLALNGDSPFWRRLWRQTNVAASRKQVAPLMRDAVAKL